MHPFQDVYARFAIDLRTLRRWCRCAYVTPHTDPVDYRGRYLTANQVFIPSRLQRVLVLPIGNV